MPTTSICLFLAHEPFRLSSSSGKGVLELYGFSYDEGAVLDPTRAGVPWPFALAGALVATSLFWVAGLAVNDVFGGQPANVLGFGIGDKDGAAGKSSGGGGGGGGGDGGGFSLPSLPKLPNPFGD